MVKTQPFTEAIQQTIIQGGFHDCSVLHESCFEDGVQRFISVIKNSYKSYLPIHIIPMLIFKRKKLLQDPIGTLKHTAYGYVKSLCFMGGYVAIVKYGICVMMRLRGKIDGLNTYIAAFVAALSLNFEPPNRRTEIALFVIPRSFEASWNWMARRNYLKSLPAGELIVFAFIIGLINYFYEQEEAAIKPTALSVFRKFWGTS